MEATTPTVTDTIITEHNTAFGTMIQHFGDWHVVNIKTDFMLKCAAYYVNGEIKRFVNPATLEALAELQQEAFDEWTALQLN